MGVDTLSRISTARPVIYAEGFFIACGLDNGKIIPEEGIQHPDILSLINGEFFNRGSDFVEEFTLKRKLQDFIQEDNAYELEQFPRERKQKMRDTNFPSDGSLEKDRQEIETDGIPLVQMKAIKSTDSAIQEGIVLRSEERQLFEKQVSWIMEEGDDFVNTETFTKVSEALLLLEVLKEYNVPSVVSFLARRGEPIAISYSKIDINLDCLMFCLFQG